MIIANLKENGICHTIYDPGNAVVEMVDNNIVIPDYDYKYLNSHYDRVTETWTYCPDLTYSWDAEAKNFYNPNDVKEEAEEPPTEE